MPKGIKHPYSAPRIKHQFKFDRLQALAEVEPKHRCTDSSIPLWGKILAKHVSGSLTSSELTQLVQIAGESGEVSNASQFRDWAQSSVRRLLPHEALIAGMARRRGDRVEVEQLLPAGFPMAFIEAVRARRGSFACPTLESWFRLGRPQLFEPESVNNHAPATDEFNTHQLKNVASHGVLSPSGDDATYFSFSRIPQPLTERHATVLELLAPHLHRAYVRAQKAHEIPSVTALRPRLSLGELAVLHELCIGGATKSIARRLDLSPNTVKHQIKSLLGKLGARERSEAVTTAFRLGFLPDRRISPVRQGTTPVQHAA